MTQTTDKPTYMVEGSTHEGLCPDGSRVVMHAPHADERGKLQAFTQAYSAAGCAHERGHIALSRQR
jgi:hypothetical protein